jgi:hypothetical protein
MPQIPDEYSRPQLREKSSRTEHLFCSHGKDATEIVGFNLDKLLTGKSQEDAGHRT